MAVGAALSTATANGSTVTVLAFVLTSLLDLENLTRIAKVDRSVSRLRDGGGGDKNTGGENEGDELGELPMKE